MNASVGWRHACGDTVPKATSVLSGGSSFTVSGVPIDKDSATLNLGVGWKLAENATLSLSYDGVYGAHTYDHSGHLNLTFQF